MASFSMTLDDLLPSFMLLLKTKSYGAPAKSLTW